MCKSGSCHSLIRSTWFSKVPGVRKFGGFPSFQRPVSSSCILISFVPLSHTPLLPQDLIECLKENIGYVELAMFRSLPAAGGSTLTVVLLEDQHWAQPY